MSLKRAAVMLLTAFCLCSFLCVGAFAETSAANSGISLAYEYADNPSCTLRISGQAAYCTSQT